MPRIPRTVRNALDQFQSEFCDSVSQRFFAMLLVAILPRGRRTILRLHDLAVRLAPGHFPSFHRVFSHRRWRGLRLAKILATAIVEHFAPERVLEIVGDDTVSQHRGKQVYGKACHRDAVRSTHGHLVHRGGHKWVVLSLRIRVPRALRTWALPVLVALYKTPELNAQEGRRHKTPAELMQGLLVLWMRRFPGRNSIFSVTEPMALTSSHDSVNFIVRDLGSSASSTPMRFSTSRRHVHEGTEGPRQSQRKPSTHAGASNQVFEALAKACRCLVRRWPASDRNAQSGRPLVSPRTWTCESAVGLCT